MHSVAHRAVAPVVSAQKRVSSPAPANCTAGIIKPEHIPNRKPVIKSIAGTAEAMAEKAPTPAKRLMSKLSTRPASWENAAPASTGSAKAINFLEELPSVMGVTSPGSVCRESTEKTKKRENEKNASLLFEKKGLAFQLVKKVSDKLVVGGAGVPAATTLARLCGNPANSGRSICKETILFEKSDLWPPCTPPTLQRKKAVALSHFPGFFDRQERKPLL